MLVEEVGQLFLEICNEQDSSFLTSGGSTLGKRQLERYLRIGHAEYRRHVLKFDDTAWATSVTINTAGGRVYNLKTGTPSIKGPTPSASKLYSILNIYKAGQATGMVDYFVHPAYSREELTAGPLAYILTGDVLTFSRDMADPLVVEYVPVSAVNWARTTEGNNERIDDDFDEWHDVIALLAAKQYMGRDWQDNAIWVSQLTVRLEDFAEYLKGYGGRLRRIESDPGSPFSVRGW